ncbi:Molybdopterin synthase sulfur carrier subunit [Stieleria neptunia]|uniref:Molybdopterin synthase sulfur carrier subunit n=1 Tax=Stieleria neptunia TaxID=2527979 RepID=A0A518HZM3_9BACT|nr:MoaD/ThiS family protein [Stieleria neptunia]QDV46301.1 Molybdopterin synthase sulfur carrier subunit [Stieleria neptunia]
MTSTAPLRILLFAGVRDAAGCDVANVAVDHPVTAAKVIESVAAQIPAAAPLIGVSRLAVDGRYVGPDHVIRHADVELALIPPVSGG